MEKFRDILDIERDNVRRNPGVVNVPTKEICEWYLAGLMDEVSEVRAEIKENNSVHLIDELSDIAWDYAVVLALVCVLYRS
jgi:NTP pyrophosphatase (non-canonical NTP hydrolase)